MISTAPGCVAAGIDSMVMEVSEFTCQSPAERSVLPIRTLSPLR